MKVTKMPAKFLLPPSPLPRHRRRHRPPSSCPGHNLSCLNSLIAACCCGIEAAASTRPCGRAAGSSLELWAMFLGVDTTQHTYMHIYARHNICVVISMPRERRKNFHFVWIQRGNCAFLTATVWGLFVIQTLLLRSSFRIFAGDLKETFWNFSAFVLKPFGLNPFEFEARAAFDVGEICAPKFTNSLHKSKRIAAASQQRQQKENENENENQKGCRTCRRCPLCPGT